MSMNVEADGPKQMRIAEAGDQKQLELIWKLAFGDEDEYIDLYFNNRNWINETAVLLQDDKIVSMLAMIPAELATEDGSRQKSAMIYAVATHPDYQKRGLADELMNFANRYLTSKGILSTFLVPAGEDLFRFYEKRGYEKAFYLLQKELTERQVRLLEVPDRLALRLVTARPEEYNAVRRRFLAGSSYIDYRDEEIHHQKRVSKQSGGDLYLLLPKNANLTGSTGYIVGCMAIEQGSDFVMVKELLSEEQYLASAVKHLSGVIAADKYIVRTPAFMGKSLGGTSIPFGMMKDNGGSAKPQGDSAYLGIAFD